MSPKNTSLRSRTSQISQSSSTRKHHKLRIEGLEDRTMMDIALPYALRDLAYEIVREPPVSLSSKPGAAHTIYLDFDGHFDANWASDGWKFSNVTTPAFNTDGVAGFSKGEQTMIREVWQRVAEDYAPFDVNVTTVDPGGWNAPNGVAMRVAFGGRKSDMHVASDSGKTQAAWNANENSGYASIGSFTNGEPNTVHVFTADIAAWAARGDVDWNGVAMAGHLAEYMGNVASHEVGHSMGLVHNHDFNSLGDVVDYYSAGTGTWTPMMGESIVTDRTTWAFGQYDAIKYSFFNFNISIPLYQDDLAILTGQLGARADDYGDSIASATVLGTSQFSLFTSNYSASGIIGTMTDADYFSFSTTGGTVNFTATTQSVGANLDARVELWKRTLDYSGGYYRFINTMIVAGDPGNSLNASVTANLAAGTYYVAVRSHGTYGDLGQYTLTGTAPKRLDVVVLSAANLSYFGGGSTASLSLAAPLAASTVQPRIVDTVSGGSAASLSQVGAVDSYFEQYTAKPLRKTAAPVNYELLATAKLAPKLVRAFG